MLLGSQNSVAFDHIPRRML